ncbi:hypothetical protein [Candidatus Lariskella endosymbiont of Epinotia ramella]|uniref:hypothetical protein n=1 Tax=Candidatus Lariskella endosymbiont of Epinotia ramella TaxID=3066224 RepID=UPI0030CEF9F5
MLFKNEAGEWHDDALNTLWLACQHLAKRNEVNTEKDDSIGRVGDNRLKVTSITSDHNIDGNKIKKVEVSLQNVKKQDFMGSEIL